MHALMPDVRRRLGPDYCRRKWPGADGGPAADGQLGASHGQTHSLSLLATIMIRNARPSDKPMAVPQNRCPSSSIVAVVRRCDLPTSPSMCALRCDFQIVVGVAKTIVSCKRSAGDQDPTCCTACFITTSMLLQQRQPLEGAAGAAAYRRPLSGITITTLEALKNRSFLCLIALGAERRLLAWAPTTELEANTAPVVHWAAIINALVRKSSVAYAHLM